MSTDWDLVTELNRAPSASGRVLGLEDEDAVCNTKGCTEAAVVEVYGG